jgi:hypothetical protein
MIEALIGSVLGGLLAIVGGLGGSFLLDRLAERRAQRILREAKRRRLLALEREMRENIELAKQPIGDAKVRFVTDVWEEVKAEVAELPADVGNAVTSSYVQASIFNPAAEYGQAKVARGQGYMNTALKEQAQRTREALEQALSHAPLAIARSGDSRTAPHQTMK